jgi:hypothetical protein
MREQKENQMEHGYTIKFSGCTGFGAVGRMCTIYSKEGSVLMCGGCGATDAEAVLETLTSDGGYTYDQAFDMVYDIIRCAARIDYEHCTEAQ